ncbi:MAG TPA: hypothetical protein VFA11_06350 [Acidimicrobiales bacterium]|nr:hypothetical protein [Acidimicrobiales bacterium]
MNDPAAAGAGPRLVVDGGRGRPWRDLGPVAWAVLCDVAASALPDPDGWAAPVGVREIAASAGVNKDTAARALAALTAAGLVVRERAHGPGGRRSVYRLGLPAGLELCPTVWDAVSLPEQPVAGSGGVRPGASDRGVPFADRNGGGAPRDTQRGGTRDSRDAAEVGTGALEHGDAAAGDLSGARDSRHQPDGPAAPLNGRQSSAGDVQRRRPHERVLGPQDGSQGQLFDVEVAVTAGSQDRAR